MEYDCPLKQGLLGLGIYMQMNRLNIDCRIIIYSLSDSKIQLSDPLSGEDYIYRRGEQCTIIL